MTIIELSEIKKYNNINKIPIIFNFFDKQNIKYKKIHKLYKKVCIKFYHLTL